MGEMEKNSRTAFLAMLWIALLGADTFATLAYELASRQEGALGANLELKGC